MEMQIADAKAQMERESHQQAVQIQ